MLRRIAVGDPVHDLVDWEHVIGEVESVGSEQLAAVQSMLTQGVIHMLKAEGWPTARDASNWRAEAIWFPSDAADRFAPSMRQKIDVDQRYRRALRAVPETIDGLAPLPLPATCQVTLNELLSERAGLSASSVVGAAAVASHQTQSDDPTLNFRRSTQP